MSSTVSHRPRPLSWTTSSMRVVCLVFLTCAGHVSAQQTGANEPARDIYGGNTGIKGKATGWFHLEKAGPQWIFITPEGHGLFPMTVAAIYFNHPGLTESGRDYARVIFSKYRNESDGEDPVPARERWAGKVRDI